MYYTLASFNMYYFRERNSQSFNSRPEQTSTSLYKKQLLGCLKNIILNLASDILECWCFFPPSYYLYSFTQLLDFITVSKYPFGALQHKGNRTQTRFFHLKPVPFMSSKSYVGVWIIEDEKRESERVRDTDTYLLT